MVTTQVTFRNTKFSFEVDDPKKLKDLVKKLESMVEGIKGLKFSSDYQIILMAAIMLMNEIDELKVELENHKKQLNDAQDTAHALAAPIIEEVAMLIEEIAESTEALTSEIKANIA